MRLRILPIALIVLGMTLLLGNLGIVPKEEIRYLLHTWWPLLLIGFGATMLLLPRSASRHRICQSRHQSPSVKADPT